ncbi:hypothetical protein CASFOL_021509 [Castilleja foliolosa]|uniref:RRM domain-containing protein n=1 Tax=Castilleja foliolosa TaxID=1961234 RepID=A0ABD3CWR4_9LAMI
MTLFHLLRPKPSLQTFRLGFLATRTKCCLSVQELKDEAGLEETGVVAVVEPIQIESSILTPMSISNKEAPYTRLADLFSNHKVDQTETTEDHKKTQRPKEALSDVLLDCHAKHKCPDSECLPHPNDPLPSEPVLDSQDGHFDESPPDKCENDESMLSDRTDTVHDLKDLYTKKSDDDQVMTEMDEPLEHSSESHHNKQGTVSKPVIKGLIDLLRERTIRSSISTSGNKKKGCLVKENALNGNLQISDRNNNRLASRDLHDGTSENDDEGTSNSDIISVDFPDAKSSSEISVPTRGKDERRLNGTSFSREETGVLVRFLHSSVLESHILQHFHSCGEILNVEFRNVRGSELRTAYIYFETEKGFKRALKKSGSFLTKYDITVEPATSIENVKSLMPNLTGDHDVPAALVKNPTRTIKIEQLSREMSSCRIKEALAFCDCNISGYFMGSSHSVAYVEFETDIGKERALAKQSINILGKHLMMLRIDPPRTTVVRISYVLGPNGLPKIMSVCRSLGVVRRAVQRNYYVIDVHFGLAEWPNMLNILNSLNGFEVEGTRLQAESAPVFPSDMLIALWHQPEERKVLKATAHGLLRKIGENTFDTSKFASLRSVCDKI